MTRRATAAATLVAALALSSLAAGAAAQEPLEPTDDSIAPKTTAGTIVVVENPDGTSTYYLDVDGPGADGPLVKLSFGPAWFWDLSKVWDGAVADGEEVEIVGNLRDGMPNENASPVAQAKAAKDPIIKINGITGAERPKGQPAWAGGPKKQLEAHPSYDGWSKGQANKAANQPPKPEQATKPVKAEKPDEAGSKPGKPDRAPEE